MARAESIKLLLRIPPDAHETIKAAAKRADVSLNSFLVTAAIQVAILGPPVLGPPAMEAPSVSRDRSKDTKPHPFMTEAGVAEVNALIDRANELDVCTHPKSARKSLGYGTRCEACGKMNP